MNLNGKTIKGVLLDISGVLVESSTTGPKAIKGSVEAVKALKDANIPVRFVTNETQRTRKSLVAMLHSNGFEMSLEQVFPPCIAMASIIKSEKLNPYFLVHPNCMEDLLDGSSNAEDPQEDVEYDSVILGDAVEGFNYKNLNQAFQIIMKKSCPFYSLGLGKYYREDGDLTLDVGPFTKAIEFATDASPTIIGKPSPHFFKSALDDIGIKAEEALMVGDDIVSDVGGAQACSMSGVLVRTGKYRTTDENHPNVTPDKIVDNLATIVKDLLKSAEI